MIKTQVSAQASQAFRPSFTTVLCLSIFLIVYGVSNRLNAAPTEAENAITFYIEKSDDIGWAHPANLIKSTIKASMGNAKYPIGHISVGVRCGTRQVHAAMTEMPGDESRRVVQKEKQGLGALFHTYTGLFENTIRTNFFVKSASGTDRFVILKIKVSPESCERALSYYDTYAQQNMGVNYGFLARPLMGEGGGCSAYATSFLDVAGTKEQWMVSSWARFLRVPMDAIGGPLTGWDKVRIRKYLLGGGVKRWASRNESHIEIFLWDPDLMVEWVKNVVARNRGVNSEEMTRLQAREVAVTRDLYPETVQSANFLISPQVVALELDRSTVQPPAAPNFATVPANPRRAIFQNPYVVDEHDAILVPNFKEVLKNWWGEDQAYLRSLQ